MTRVLHQVQVDGAGVEGETMAALSPYIRRHTNRFGRDELDLNRRLLVIDYGLDSLTSPGATATPATVTSGSKGESGGSAYERQPK
jgi:hypothetical protein